MEPRQLHYFVTIAELGSIAAASRNLHIAQPALTRQIQNLEESLSVELFYRHARGVTLTPAGSQFYQDALTILQDIAQAKLKAIKAHRGTTGSLTIGITPQHLWLTEIQQHFYAFRHHNPHISLNLCTMASGHQLMSLREGRIDAAFMFSRPKEDESLQGQLIYQESMLLAVHKESPFAKHPPTKLKELLQEDFIWSPAKNSLYLHKVIIHELERLNFTPHVVHEGCNYSSMLALVSMGMGYSFIPAVLKQQHPYNVVLHLMPELDITIDLELVWRKDNLNPCLPHLIKDYETQITRLK